MASVFSDDPGASVREREAFALRHHMALWDVLASCDIDGANDSSIRNPHPNDIGVILRSAPIRVVVTTGIKAGQLYRSLIEPGLRRQGIATPMMTLASTSPANASKSLEDLIAIYHDAFTQAGVLTE